ncbi:UTP-glucose-1-phosphate uridylyltransferase [Trypanosoma equiperdum]|uniref:UTP--glucose-1-phosphate uridylyltransferase n=2 Tax=Trypanozoon TaxID=39700 RepID=Q388T4_TRYB2|nr:UTP-glucose-1-phosphate uridylyltransferase 2, putative [Trypanosoma brucei brucei TREU927]EAN78686.1 UTP-glucose-1-phosphate uridylyltransferase 2, putative [Trypanosoma brucei brucei TREU927]SCU72670.1 UTP-glucose-1-phosphate uridylyltransferase [Trypanosoma equiperdum]
MPLNPPSAFSGAALACLEKMQASGVEEKCIHIFLIQHALVRKGETGYIPEKSIFPVESLPFLQGIETKGENTALLRQAVVLKLNGGLGTGMGLNGPKSLLQVKNGQTFLDFTALQLEHFRQVRNCNVPFMLMNSFSTSGETKNFLRKYPTLYEVFDSDIELMQNRVPKIRQDNFFPVTYEADPTCEWVPPGHGDVYTVLYSSGKLDYLLGKGYRYMFISNGDNLGATLDVRLLDYMHEKQLGFLMEVCRRTESDKKGGHLAYKDVIDETTGQTRRRFVLRESAQCPKEDEDSFQNIAKHCFFNTNNIWINLMELKKMMDEQLGVLRLPVMRNPKTVNPQDSQSTKVYQLEVAMGAAISLFDRSEAVVVPRERFAPVKTCSDLLALRSDAYQVTEDQRLVLCEERNGKPPAIDLDGEHYKMIDGFEKLVKGGVPSLRQCTSLTVRGLVEFGADVSVRGNVVIKNLKEEPLIIGNGRVLDNEVVVVE